MNQQTRTLLAIALWTGPLLLGMAFAAWIVVAMPQRGTKGRRVVEPTWDDRDRLQGSWVGVSLERDGTLVYRDGEALQAEVHFDGDTVIFEDQGATLEGTFRLDPTRVPKTFDLTVAEDDVKPTCPVGIYRLSDDTFRLCFAFPRAVRPSEFATFPGPGRTLFV